MSVFCLVNSFSAHVLNTGVIVYSHTSTINVIVIGHNIRIIFVLLNILLQRPPDCCALAIMVLFKVLKHYTIPIHSLLSKFEVMTSLPGWRAYPKNLKSDVRLQD